MLPLLSLFSYASRGKMWVPKMRARRMTFWAALAVLCTLSNSATGQTTDTTRNGTSPEESSDWMPEMDKPKAMSGDYYNTFHHLHLQILQSYNRHIRPEIGSGLPMTCNFSMIVTHVGNVDEDGQTMDLHGWVIMSWYDHRLAWNDSAEYQDIDKLLIDQKFIWKPDLHLYNNARQKLDTLVSTETRAQLFKDGRVLIDPAMLVRPYCQFNYQQYPWETHKCAIYLGSWAYRKHELRWQFHPVTPSALSVIFANSHRAYPTNWRIISETHELEQVSFDGEVWHYVNVSFAFKRTSTFGVSLVLVPAAIASVLTAFAFLLAAGTNGKLLIILTTLVMEIVHYIAIHSILPQGVINGGPLIISLCKANIFITLLSFILGCIVNLLSTRCSAPAWLLRIVQHKCFNLVCSFSTFPSDERGNSSPRFERNRRPPQEPILVTNQLLPPKRIHRQSDEHDRNVASSSMNQDNTDAQSGGPWRRFGVALDRILFILLTVIYAILWACYVGF